MASASGIGRVLYKTEFEKGVLISNFEKRGWERGDSDDWNFFWATKETTRSVFNPGAPSSTASGEDRIRLSDRQIINHFPNHLEITRKDNLAKNCKRYRREMEREGQSVPEIVPLTFQLPQEYTLFVDYASRAGPNACWIAKPVGKSQGQGIFLFTKLSKIKHFQAAAEKRTVVEPHVVSRYIHNPLLVGGKKFDLRIYALVTSYKPLKLWLYKEGFCRFCNVKYRFSLKEKDLENFFMHLTNVAIQKHNEDYNDVHGGKWSLKNLRLYLEGTRGLEATDACFRDMELLVYHACKAVQPVMISDRHCFEMYGFDLMIDDTLKPWLLEVNGSPSLTYTTEQDRLLKYALINDTLDIVMPAFADSVLRKMTDKRRAAPRTKSGKMKGPSGAGVVDESDEDSDVSSSDGGESEDDVREATPDTPKLAAGATVTVEDVAAAGIVTGSDGFNLAAMRSLAKHRMNVGGYDLLCDEAVGVDPFTRTPTSSAPMEAHMVAAAVRRLGTNTRK